MKIITNNVPRLIIDGFELSESERARFDYLNWDGIDAGTDSASFFRYKGELHDLGNFMRTNIPGWDGIEAGSAFSGTLVRYADSTGEAIVVGRVLT